MKIHEILDESLPISTAKAYRTYWNPNTYADFFQKYPSDKDKNAFRLYIPLKPTKVPEVKVPKNISEYLSSLGYDVLDYKSGIAVKKSDKRQIRIGKLLSKEPKLKQEFDNDKSRQATKKQDILVCISRHPYDIAGMSTGRGWTSCMNLTDGSNKKYVLQDVKQGTIIAYLIDSDDKNITHPIGRMLIKPYINDDNDSDIILVREDRVYGTDVTGFKEVVDKFIKLYNKNKESGLYCFNDKLYNDTTNRYVYHYDPKFIKNFNNLSEKEQLEYVQNDWKIIKYIKNPSENVQLAAVTQDGFAIEYIKNPSEKIQLIAIKHYGSAIQFIKNPSENVQLTAVTKDGYAIKFIKNPSENVQLAAVTQNGLAIKYIKNPSENVQIAAVTQNGHAIEYIDNPSEKIQLAAVKQDGLAIYYIKNPNEKIQLAAVTQNGCAIEYIDNPSEKIQLAAVTQTGHAIQYIKNPYPSVLEYAQAYI